jgi:gluconate 2-dehydrogenase gamma chain
LTTNDNQAAPDAGRRNFLRGSGAVIAASWVAANLPIFARAAEAAHAAKLSGAAFVNLSVEDAADLAAVAARIVPTDETPGATEAGVVWFIDQALGDQPAGSVFAGWAPAVRDGLTELNTKVVERTGKARFALLDVALQDDILRSIEDGEWFGRVRFLTLAGLLTMPSYGGNRDLVGWKLIGFEHRHVWSPPFGYYDAQAGQGSDGHG